MGPLSAATFASLSMKSQSSSVSMPQPRKSSHARYVASGTEYFTRGMRAAMKSAIYSALPLRKTNSSSSHSPPFV